MSLDNFYKAEELEKEGKREEAITAYTDFITNCHTNKLEPKAGKTLQEKLALAYNNRGLLYYLKVEFTLAVQDYTQALAHDNTLAVSYYNRGLIHYRLGRFSEAVEDLKEALALKPELEPAQKCFQQSLKDLQLKKDQCVE